MKWLAGLVVAMAVGAARAQAPVERRLPDEGTLEVKSRLVSIALNVTDAHGTAVPGLTKDDFQVFEDGKLVPTAVFEKESATPLDIVVAVDASESMFSYTKLERDAAKRFAATILKPDDNIDLMSFSDDVTEVVGFTHDVHRFDEGFSQMHRGEATAVYDALYLAAQRLRQQPQKPGGRRVILMITDGENTVHHGSYPEALEEAQRAGAMVYSLIVVPVDADAGRNTGGEHALIQISQDTGGKYFEMEDKHDFAPAFAHVSDDLRAQYTVGYYAPHKAIGDAGLRHVEIRLKDPEKGKGWTLRYRTAYYAR